MATRQQLFDLCTQFHDNLEKPVFVPGESYIPCSGKVLNSDDLVALVDASLDMWLTAGRFAREFEARLAKVCGLKYARAVNSGSSANLVAFSALTSHKLERPISPGSEVITVAAGFPTTVAPIIQNGCIPVFVDVDLKTGNVDANRLEDAVTEKTRAIMLAHTLGNPFDVASVVAVAEKYGLFLVEDCCDALGASYNGKPVGTFGDVATLSFYPAHHITMGEGGAVLTNANKLNRIIESFRDWGRDCWCDPGKDDTCGKRFDWRFGKLPDGYDHKYVYSHLGYNLKITDMQAAVGCSQLGKLDGFVEKRRSNFEMLRTLFEKEGLDEYFHLPQATNCSKPSWFGFLLSLRDDAPFKRRDFVAELERRRVGTRQLFGGNLTCQPAFANVNYRVSGGLDVTDKIMRDSFWVGVWPGLGEAQISYMVEAFKQSVETLKP